MEYGFSILMTIFSAVLLLYAGMMALFKDYKMLPFRAQISVKPKNKKKYMMQFAKVIALLAVSPALSALIGLWNLLVAMIVLIIATIFFIWIGVKIMKNVE